MQSTQTNIPMKNKYLLIAGLVAMFFSVKAQQPDTILYESFNLQSFYDNLLKAPDEASLSDLAEDSQWYSYSVDGLSDGSPNADRSHHWFPSGPFSIADSIADTLNFVIASNSWTNDASTPVDRWLITPNIKLGDHDTLFWKAAPRQTPRFLDGYEVLISTTTNLDLSFDFNNPLFTAAEMTGPIPVPADTLFSAFTFSTGFVHGEDTTYIDLPANVEDPAKPSYRGQLRPFSVPLDVYANKNVFIAFRHTSHDDNLISIDDVMVRGTASNPNASIGENVRNRTDIKLSVCPNPAAENVKLSFELSAESNVVINIADVTGKLVYSENKGKLSDGRQSVDINTSVLGKGFYTVSVQTNKGQSVTKLIVK